MSDEVVLKELKKISKILTVANSTAIENELTKIATSTGRKKMWTLIDGNRMPKEIADEAGVSAMAVSNFLNVGKASELIEYEKGKAPIRLLDYVPPSWIELFTPVPSEEESVKNETKPNK